MGHVIPVSGRLVDVDIFWGCLSFHALVLSFATLAWDGPADGEVIRPETDTGTD